MVAIDATTRIQSENAREYLRDLYRASGVHAGRSAVDELRERIGAVLTA